MNESSVCECHCLKINHWYPVWLHPISFFDYHIPQFCVHLENDFIILSFWSVKSVVHPHIVVTMSFMWLEFYDCITSRTQYLNTAMTCQLNIELSYFRLQSETITKSWASEETPASERSPRPTGNLLKSGIPTTSRLLPSSCCLVISTSMVSYWTNLSFLLLKFANLTSWVFIPTHGTNTTFTHRWQG